MSACPLEVDDAIGPVVVDCRYGFDFTLFFEQLILSALPNALFIIASVASLVIYWRQDVKTIPSLAATYLKTAKLTLSASFGVTQTALVVLWATSTTPTRASVPAAALSLIGSIILIALSYFQHDRSAKPSTVLLLYLALSLVLDLAQARTLWLRQQDEESTALAAVFTSAICLKLGCLILEAWEKPSLLRSPYREYCPEALSGVLNRSVFFWLNRLLLQGSSRDLDMNDLFDIDDDLRSERLHSRFRQRWFSHSLESKQNKPFLLLWISLCSCQKPLLISIACRILLIGFKFSQPLLIKTVVTLLSESNKSTRGDNNDDKVDVVVRGRGLIGAAALIYLGIALMNGQFRHHTYRLITMFRGGLVCLIYDATLDLNASEAAESAAVTLMSTDVDRIANGFEMLDALWAGPIEVGLGTFMLYLNIGPACAAPVVVATCFVGVSLAIGKMSASAQKQWVQGVENRVAATARALANIKGLKMSGLSKLIEQELESLRTTEMSYSRRYRWILTASTTISNMSLSTMSTVTLAAHILIMRFSTGIALEPSIAFTLLSVVSLIALPVQEMSVAIPQMAAACGCFQRVQKYLASLDRALHQEETASVGTTDTKDAKDVVVQTRNADFSFASSTITGPRTLQNISITIRSGTWTVVFGPVGSGKSALLLSLLGELRLTKGSLVKRPHVDVAYCGQEPWLPNLTIRQIITSLQEFDQAWYSTVIKACCLDRDLRELPRGDETVVGSGGISLSGGQKQRLSLARAVYSRRRLLLLDDVLGGLDPTTEQAIVDRVMGSSGLCRQHGMTMILATHSVRHARAADQVIELAHGGSIEKQGPPTEFTLPIANDEQIDDNVDTIDPQGGSPQGPESQVRRIPENSTALGRDKEEEDNIDQKPVSQPRTGDIRLYGYYLKAMGWSIAVGLAYLDMVFVFSFKFPTVLLNFWTAAESQSPGQWTDMYLGLYGMFSGICLVSFFGLAGLLMQVGMPRSSVKLHRRLLQATLQAPYWFLVTKDSGEILNRFSQDMALIDMQLPVSFLNAIFLFMLCFMEAVLIASTSKWAVLMYPGIIPVLYVLQMFYLRTSRRMRLLEIEAKAPLFTDFSETLRGLTTIRAYGWQDKFRARSRALLDESQKPYYLLWSIQRWLSLVLDMMVGVIAVVILCLATQVGDSSAGSLGISLVNLLTFSQNLTNLIRAWVDLETSLGAVSRLRHFERTTPNENLAGEGDTHVPDDWPVSGEVVFQNMSASYKEDYPAVLEHITFHIQPGQKVGVCGRTGSGKSSLILSLLKMVSVGHGDVFIDGVAISGLSRSLLRRRIDVMPQEPLLLYSNTVRANLDPWTECTDSEIRAALVRVGLDAGVVGLDSRVADIPLSAGQQQQLCLARAVLGRSRVLLLDEATANLDRESQKAMMDMMVRGGGKRDAAVGEDRPRRRTVVAVAHHLHTLEDFDMILVLDNGRIIECGAPDELLKRPDSLFSELWRSQS